MTDSWLFVNFDLPTQEFPFVLTGSVKPTRPHVLQEPVTLAYCIDDKPHLNKRDLIWFNFSLRLGYNIVHGFILQ